MVCVSRDWSDGELILSVLCDTSAISRIIHGAAPGADTLAGVAARTLGTSVQALPVDWERYGHAAGATRNQAMPDEGRPDLVLGFTEDHGTCRGGNGMVPRARLAGIPVRLTSHAGERTL
ncbi:MAG: hypothetical protein KGI98_09625 [Euryarchaeota archaeon]|nr:hypothetical protein [Euryarchaeota archaeon]